jgi:hypothetical protein
LGGLEKRPSKNNQKNYCQKIFLVKTEFCRELLRIKHLYKGIGSNTPGLRGGGSRHQNFYILEKASLRN